MLLHESGELIAESHPIALPFELAGLRERRLDIAIEGGLKRFEALRQSRAVVVVVERRQLTRLLRDLASGQATVGDTTTLEDFSVLAKLREEEE